MGKYDSFNSYNYGVHQKIVNYVGLNKKVLDVGCAEGILSKKFLNNKCEVVGVELDESSAISAKRYCKEVIIGDLETLKLKRKYQGYFDVLVFADVLEHLKEPSKVLKRFQYCLKDDGLIIISIPNVANWRMRLKLLLGNFEYKDHGLLDYTHLRFYNFKSVKKLIATSNLEIINFDVSLNGIRVFPKFFYKVAINWPNLFAYQFLIIARKK